MQGAYAYRVFLTRNSEYHVRDGWCFGVRDRRTGQWQDTHPALGQPLADRYKDAGGRVCSVTAPMVGDPLTFSVEGQALLTSAILSIENHDALDAAVVRVERAFARRPQLSPRDTH